MLACHFNVDLWLHVGVLLTEAQILDYSEMARVYTPHEIALLELFALLDHCLGQGSLELSE